MQNQVTKIKNGAEFLNYSADSLNVVEIRLVRRRVE